MGKREMNDYGFDPSWQSLLANLSRANERLMCTCLKSTFLNIWRVQVVEKRLAPGTGTWRCLCQVLPHHAPAQSHLRIVCIAMAIAEKCLCISYHWGLTQCQVGWGMDADGAIYTVLPLWRGQKCLWLERHSEVWPWALCKGLCCRRVFNVCFLE